MSQIQELFQQFQNKEIDSFNFQQQVFEFYKKSDKSEETKKEILELIEITTKDESAQDYMWAVFFESDRGMYKKIDLLQNKIQAEKYCEINLKDPSSIGLDSTASLAYTMCKTDNGYDMDKEAVWLDVFKTIPEFKSALETEKQYWNDFHKKTQEEYKQYFDGIQEIKNRPILESYEIFVPLVLGSDNQALWTSKEVGILIDEIVDDFNNFGLEGYMDSFKGKCSNSTVEFNNGFTFRFDCYEKMDDDELKKGREDFLGQLSDGWGENASQRCILVGSEEVTIDFVLDESSEFSVSPIKKKKPNM